MSIKKERVPAIEYMRGISMLGVVGIHVGSQYLMNNPTPNLQLLALYEIVTRFSVPIFFFISAFGLFYNLDLQEKFNYKNFMKRRFKTVLIPYLVWSIFYILHYTITNQTLYLLHPLNLIGILFFGLACYQLYFMILLVWFYALMPLWIFIVKRLNIVLLVVLFVFQMAVDYYYCIYYNGYSPEGSINTAHQLSPAGLVYTLGASLYLFAEFQYGFLAKIGTSLFSLLGRHSYFVYLAHPVAITYLALFMAKFNIVMTAVNSMIFYVLVVLFTLIVAIIFRKLGNTKYPKLNELTIGVYPKK